MLSTMIVGDRVTGMALPWLILAQTHSAFDAGVVSAARYLPLVTLGLAAGFVADRVDRRHLMILCDLSRAAALSAVILASALRRYPPGELGIPCNLSWLKDRSLLL